MYWLRLRSPGKSKVFSLRTADKLAAEMMAAPLIADHKAALLAAKPRIEFVWRQAYTSGLHDTPDGKVFATDRELHYLDAAARADGTHTSQSVHATPPAATARTTRAAGDQRAKVYIKSDAPVAASAQASNSAISCTLA
jgi:hypothetical protein